MKKLKTENRIIKSETIHLSPESFIKYLDEQEQIEKNQIQTKYLELKKRLEQLKINLNNN